MILIDYSNIAYANITQDVDVYNEYPDKLKFILGSSLMSILKIKKKFYKDYGRIVLACDGRRNWRKDVFEYYKAGREESRRATGILDWDEIFKNVDIVKDILKESFPYDLLQVDNAEADDIIATLIMWAGDNDFVHGESNSLFDENVNRKVNPQLIISRDTDFFQLHKFPYVKQYSNVKEDFIKPDCSPEDYLQEHILTGDRGDGIPTVLSEGHVFVTKTRQKPLRATRKAEMLADMEKLEKNPFYQRNKQLIDLTQIPQNIRDNIVETFLSYKVPDTSNIFNILVKHKLPVLASRIEEFKP